MLQTILAFSPVAALILGVWVGILIIMKADLVELAMPVTMVVAFHYAVDTGGWSLALIAVHAIIRMALGVHLRNHHARRMIAA